MSKEQLVDKQQHEVVVGDVTKRFTIYVTKGTDFRLAEYDGVEQVVQIKAFRISVKEEWVWEDQPYREIVHDFGYVTSRAGEFAGAVRRMRECDSIKKMRVVIASLHKDFRGALTRDATRELKRILGVGRVKPPLARRATKHPEPLPQIKLPWMKQE
jgi:hypothetical protein